MIPKSPLIKNNSSRFFFLLWMALLFLAFLSSLGLDFINWKSTKKSYVFSFFFKEKDRLQQQNLLKGIILRPLYSADVSESDIHQYQDSSGILHVMINLPYQKYTELEFLLSKELRSAQATVLKKESQELEEAIYHLWEIEGKEKQRLTLLFSCPKELAKKTPVPPAETGKNKVALVIDDMGFSLKAIKDICSLRQPVTVSILPYSPLAKETARIAHENQLDIILHLPLESLNNTHENNSTEGLIHSRMSQEEILETMERNLSQVPFIKGVNNHMGSKITANRQITRTILERLKEKNLFFLDSRTSSQSVAYAVSQELGLPSAFRHVFLDSEIREDYIKEKLFELFLLAQGKGMAIGICHPNEETLKVLKENFHRFEEYGLEPVFVSQVVQ